GGRGGARPRARRAAREPYAPRREPHPRPDRGTRPRPAGAGMRRYFSDVAVLARKDLVLEFRARDTLPAMLLFVVSVLVIFHFALPRGSSRTASVGLLWVAIVFTALLGLARSFVAEREQGLLDGLVLAPCDRSAIWLAKGIATFVFLALAELVALPAFALLFAPVHWSTIAGVALAGVVISAVGTLLAA